MAKVFIEETTLTAIGDAIRGKEGSSELVPVNDMASRITDLPSGGGGGGYEPTDEELTLTGSGTNLFASNRWKWVVDNYGDRIQANVNSADAMFYNSTQYTEIPFDIKLLQSQSKIAQIFYGCSNLICTPTVTVINKQTSSVDAGDLFYGCYKLEELGYIYNAYPSAVDYMFFSCRRLRNIPDDYFDTWDFSKMLTGTTNYANYLFNDCHSLRKIPTSLFEKFTDSKVTGSSGLYVYLLAGCFTLDEAINIPVITAKLTADRFSHTFGSLFRAKRITFKTNEDGTPKTAEWKSQTINFSSYHGYVTTPMAIFDYNSGITADKEVKDDATYQALKNDPDWFTFDVNYSRYNHDSAVETINSLPDTSAYLATQSGATNTIKFQGAAGSATDGGAINTLTAEEIAVAAAKGWTVTLS